MFFPGGWEFLILVLVIVLLLFGKRVPQLARNLGRSFVEFKAGLKGKNEDEESEKEIPPGTG